MNKEPKFEKPVDCTCSYPEVICRNMNGHDPSCPVYQRWYKQVYEKCEPIIDGQWAEVPDSTVIDSGYKAAGVSFRRFYLNRIKDETGISRTGRVLEGVLAQSGKVFVEWRPPHSTIGIYNSMEEFKTIHVDCHPSCNEIVWIDEYGFETMGKLAMPIQRCIEKYFKERYNGTQHPHREAVLRDFVDWLKLDGRA